jgi:diaminopimelate epimerase
MTRNFEIPFQKFHGLGNDFIVSAVRDISSFSLPQLAQAIANRHTVVGADGFLVLSPPRSRKHDARLRVFNADGSEAEMSGNGIRCAAAFLLEDKRRNCTLVIETLAGVKTIEPIKVERDRWVFRVGMGAPILTPAKIPFRSSRVRAPIVGFSLRTQRGALSVTVTSMGNPHCTVLVADLAHIDWASLGREIEGNRLFPKRTNVEFVKVISRSEIEVRFWERGVGETASSGTGSCAAVVACILNGRTSRKVRVRTKAGILYVAWPDKSQVTLTGPVERVARGTYYHRG